MSNAAQHTAPGPGVPPRAERPLVLELSSAERQKSLGQEARRALALMRGLNLLGDPAATRALMKALGKDTDGKQRVSVSEADCLELAARLRQRGYPLTDDGVRAFKLERGHSDQIRIGPEVALTYARYFAGRDVRVVVPPEDLQALDLEARRALKLLALIAETPSELQVVARALGHPDPTDGETGQAVLGRDLATRLVDWAHAAHIAFTNEGLLRIAEALRWPSALVDGRLARFVTDALLTRGEPVHDYSRLTCQGCTLNGRTVAMLSAVLSKLAGLPLRVLKGSYEASVHQGAHPHMGGGVADLSVKGLVSAQVEELVRELRRGGFAAWFRPREDRPHVHAVAIGDREMAPAAQWQVRQYFLGRDGRSRMGPDPHGGPPGDLPSWVLRHRLAA